MRLRLYHGTPRAFDRFDESSIGRGADANSSLGVHLCEDAELAWYYATIDGSPEAQVLVVDVLIERAGLVGNSLEFFGIDDGGNQIYDAQDYALASTRLSTSGLCAVAVDDISPEVAGTWVVFDPGRISVVGRLTSEQDAIDVPRPEIVDLEIETVSVFDDVDARLARRQEHKSRPVMG